MSLLYYSNTGISMISYSLQNQSALVTGADSGIGKGVALELAKAGAKLLINYAHNEHAAQEVVSEIKAGGGEAFAYRADVSHEGEVQAMFAELFKQYGTIDILVNSFNKFLFCFGVHTGIFHYYISDGG